MITFNTCLEGLQAAAVVCGVCTAGTILSESSNNRCPRKSNVRCHHEKVDPLVGTWSVSVTVTGAQGNPLSPQNQLTVYGNLNFHADGTLDGGDTGSVGDSLQPLPVPFVQLATPQTGNWKKIGKRRYQALIVFMVATTATGGFPTTLAFREGVNVNITLTSKTTFQSSLVANSFAPSDLNLSNGQPLLSGTAIGVKNIVGKVNIR